MNLLYLNFNNYYNRRILKKDTIADYLPFQVGSIDQGVQFNPNDGVVAQQDTKRDLHEIGNYLVCFNEDNTIDSRWFIIEVKRARQGYYKLSLKRDTITDYYYAVINAPIFIEKATLQNNNPLIFNKEGMTYNQIKKSETLLKDRTGIPWIVGYYARTDGENVTTLTGTYKYTSLVDMNVEYSSQNFPFTTKWYKKPLTDSGLYISVNTFRQIKDNDRYIISKNSSNRIDEPGKGSFINIFPSDTIGSFKTDYSASEFKNKFEQSMNTQHITWKDLSENAQNLIDSLSQSKLDELFSFDGKVLKTVDNKYLKVKIKDKGITIAESLTIDNNSGALFVNLSSILSGFVTNPNVNNTTFIGSYYQVQAYDVEVTELTNLTDTGNFEISQNRYELKDAPYDMFCIPYGDLTIKSNGTELVKTSAETGLAVAMGIGEKYFSNFLYDLQLLPYCPLESVIVKEDGTIDVMGDTNLYNLTTDSNGRTSGIIFNSNISSWSFNIQLQTPLTSENIKITNECDLWRLCSPNYNGLFDFNVAKNGSVEYFNVDCTYKPYNPYIHVNPNFSNLYGADYNDSRGLICSGDYSLPVVTDQFKQYEINNKNYANIQARGIQNLEITNQVQREKQQWEIATGAISSAISGATSGALTGGVVGGIIGGIVGGGASIAGGLKDYELSERTRQESINYSNDMFSYSLGNIKALPDSIAKVSSFTYNNKYFPFLEYYTCTDAEKEALRLKLKYSGMTVMAIGTIADYLQGEESFIKGQLIRLEINEDSHLVNDIYKELNKGVFI